MTTTMASLPTYQLSNTFSFTYCYPSQLVMRILSFKPMMFSKPIPNRKQNFPDQFMSTRRSYWTAHRNSSYIKNDHSTVYPKSEPRWLFAYLPRHIKNLSMIAGIYDLCFLCTKKELRYKSDYPPRGATCLQTEDSLYASKNCCFSKRECRIIPL